jgi:hypothetical protein
MNFVFNSPSIPFMRNIKDSMSREDYNNITEQTIEQFKNKERGIMNTVLEIIEFVKSNKLITLSMNDVYHTFMESGL